MLTVPESSSAASRPKHTHTHRLVLTGLFPYQNKLYRGFKRSNGFTARIKGDDDDTRAWGSSSRSLKATARKCFDKIRTTRNFCTKTAVFHFIGCCLSVTSVPRKRQGSKADRTSPKVTPSGCAGSVASMSQSPELLPVAWQPVLPPLAAAASPASRVWL